MRVLPGGAERWPVVSGVVLLAALSLLATAVYSGTQLKIAAPVALFAVVGAVAYRHERHSWRNLLALLLLIVLFIPIRRYTFPGSLPFQLEPYRLYVLILASAWVVALLVDPRIRLRRTTLGPPLGLILLVALLSTDVNPGRVLKDHSVVTWSGAVTSIGIESEVAKRVTFFLSFLVVFLLLVSVVRTFADVDYLVKFLVGGGAVLAILGLIESRLHYNVFNHFASFIPILKANHLPYSLVSAENNRGGRLRVYGSAEDPIAFGALLTMLVPLAIYLYRATLQRRWLVAASLLGLAALATVSRTVAVMMIVILVVYLLLRPRETKRFWPLIVPLIVVVHLALPGTLGSLSGAFFPKGGLVAEQKRGAGTYGSGRVADIGPSLHELSYHAVLGEGFGTRVVDKEKANAHILDDQWLGTLLETGILGVASWIWLFSRAIRRLWRAARDPSPRGWLCVGLAGSLFAYAIGMFTYDAFSFTQATLVMFVLLAIASVVLDKTSLTPRAGLPGSASH
jgi:polysaccharide biosynthesis protein PslJ